MNRMEREKKKRRVRNVFVLEKKKKKTILQEKYLQYLEGKP